MKIFIPQFITLTATGLLAGAFIYGLLNVVPAFYEVPVNVHLRYRAQLMGHNSITMQTLMAVSIIAPLWYAWVGRPAVLVLALTASLFALTSLLVTRFGNVPINQLIKTWSPDHLPADWMTTLRTWDKFNLVRALAALACFVTSVAAVLADRWQN